MFVKRFGISGAALAWALRALLDALLMFGAAFWISSVSFRSLLHRGLRRTLLAVAVLGAGLAMIWLANGPLIMQVLLAVSLVLVFVFVSWTHVLDSRDRDLLAVTATHVRLAFARPK